ncbi:MAG: alpha-L-rhamnosidase N-terminal domain-containing protein, partial [Clostridia bacterium]|nr:alpha-L-rhamnosidase N-terminal domain-containing protein [Clostridia bacterium]
MWINAEKPDISWIANKRTDGSEWIVYTKEVITDKQIKSAVIRFETDCTCAVYVNDNFIISGTGRTPERVNCHEVTSRLVTGTNEIKVVLGGAYYQQRGLNITNFRGYRLSSFAMELCVEYSDGTKLVIPTDSSWTANIDGQSVPATETMPVTDAEYYTMWSNATPWLEPKLHAPAIDDAVIKTAGSAYANYARREAPEYIYPSCVAQTNMKECGGKYIPDAGCDETPYIIYDFGRLVIGYSDILYNAKSDTMATLHYDFSEKISDFDHDPKNQWTYVIEALIIKQKLSNGDNSAFNLRRRAFRLLKIEFEKDSVIELDGVRVKPCLFPAEKHGWFNCSDPMLNEMWETGKYTLQVNKHQEYESCPRNEMEFFAGDGYIDALIDLYAFGDERLLNTSLSLNFSEACTGITHTADFNKSRHQWDYYGWRIICVYLHYKVTGDKEFLKRQ